MTISATMDVEVKQFQGLSVPTLGFGTFELKGDDCRRAVDTALEVGYRHLDTARDYGNEASVGKAFHESGLDREDVFITSKIWRDDLDSASVVREIRKSLETLRTDYLDLVLIHWPNPEFSLEATLQAMLGERECRHVRAIGVSNFPASWFKRALAYAPIVCNQVEYHPMLSQDKLLGIARAHDAMLTAYSPLAQGEVLERRELHEIAEKHGKKPGQIALRWLVEQDHVVAIPRSASPDHIRDNFDIFDFELDASDNQRIAQMQKGRRLINPDFAPDWEDDQ